MILTGALARGLNFEGIKEMELGQIVDFCIEYNNIHDESDEEYELRQTNKKKRKATQADWDAFFG